MRLVPALALLAVWPAAPIHAQTITGPAAVIDGKTLDMTGSAVILAHIDTPEIKQGCDRGGAAWSCGTEAAENLAAIVGRAPVTCTVIGAGAQGIPLAICENETFDLGREMVRRGMALAIDGAPEEYGAASEIARQLGYGLWAATYQAPADWRLANPTAVTRIARAQIAVPERRSGKAGPSPDRRYTNTWGCAIKGNRSRRGEWIYHLPGQVYYEDTRPEDLFCTEREAQAAGYRRSKE